MPLEIPSKHILKVLKYGISLNKARDFSLQLLNQFTSLTPQNVLELYLHVAQYFTHGFAQVIDVPLNAIRHPSAQILRPLRAAIVRDVSEEIRSSGAVDGAAGVTIEERVDDDFQRIAEKMKTQALPALEALLGEHLPGLPFVPVCLKTLREYPVTGHEGSLPLLNMAGWFIWICAKIKFEHRKLKLDRLEAIEPKRGTAAPMVFFHVLKEILYYADPQGRYTLTGIFLDQLSGRKFELYFRLAEGVPQSVLVPLIPLCRIALQAESREKHRCIMTVNSILPLISSSLFEGHYYRTLVKTLLMIASDDTTRPLERLQLIARICDKSSHYDRLHQLVVGDLSEQLATLFGLGKDDEAKLKALHKARADMYRAKKSVAAGVDTDFEVQTRRIEDETNQITSKGEALLRQRDTQDRVAALLQTAHCEDVGLAAKINAILPGQLLDTDGIKRFHRRLHEMFSLHCRDQEFRGVISRLMIT